METIDSDWAPVAPSKRGRRSFTNRLSSISTQASLNDSQHFNYPKNFQARASNNLSNGHYNACPIKDNFHTATFANETGSLKFDGQRSTPPTQDDVRNDATVSWRSKFKSIPAEQIKIESNESRGSGPPRYKTAGKQIDCKNKSHGSRDQAFISRLNPPDRQNQPSFYDQLDDNKINGRNWRSDLIYHHDGGSNLNGKKWRGPSNRIKDYENPDTLNIDVDDALNKLMYGREGLTNESLAVDEPEFSRGISCQSPNVRKKNNCGLTSVKTKSMYHRHANQMPSLELKELIIEALFSLYRDALKPTTSELRRRLTESKVPISICKRLPEICKLLSEDICFDESSQQVFLRNPPDNFDGFVDPKDPHDPFPCCIWQDYMSYLTKLMQDKIHDSSEGKGSKLLQYQFEEGRYGMAAKMKSDPRLKSQLIRHLSVGQLCHLVQLSIAYGIMQYENNILQPRATCLRIAAAFAQSDLEEQGLSSSFKALQHEEDAKMALRSVLLGYKKGMLLSQLKLEIQNKFSSRLSQSIFGCTRLTNLLQLPQYQEFCRIISDNTGRVFVQAVEYPIPVNMKCLNASRRRFSEMTPDEMKKDLRISIFPCEESPCSNQCRTTTFQHWRFFANPPESDDQRNHGDFALKHHQVSKSDLDIKEDEEKTIAFGLEELLQD